LADVDATLMEKVFDVPKRKREPRVRGTGNQQEGAALRSVSSCLVP